MARQCRNMLKSQDSHNLKRGTRVFVSLFERTRCEMRTLRLKTARGEHSSSVVTPHRLRTSCTCTRSCKVSSSGLCGQSVRPQLQGSCFEDSIINMRSATLSVRNTGLGVHNSHRLPTNIFHHFRDVCRVATCMI